jgi:hypothetical protein
MKMMIVELEDAVTGMRFWSAPMAQDEVGAYIDAGERDGYLFSDSDVAIEK